MRFPILRVLLALLIAVLLVKLFVLLFEARMAFFPFKGIDETPRDRGIAYTDFSVKTSDGETINAWTLPASPPTDANASAHTPAQVLYFHGNGGNLSIWLPILEGLHRRGLTVVALDYRGYGQSTGASSERGLYRDADAFVDHFWSRIHQPGTSVIYWGRSLGATVAAYAATRRAPDGLILEGAFPSASALLRTNPIMAVLGWFSSYRFPTARFLESVNRPILVMHGDSDGVIPFRLGEQLFAGLRGSKRFHRIKGGDHNDLAPSDPDAYWAAVTDFISRVREGR